MRASISLEKSITNNEFYVVINETFYITITEKTFEELAQHLGMSIKEQSLKYIDCKDCKYMYDCERTYLGGCTDGAEWEENDND